jgi:hypothetical protein
VNPLKYNKYPRVICGDKIWAQSYTWTPEHGEIRVKPGLIKPVLIIGHVLGILGLFTPDQDEINDHYDQVRDLVNASGYIRKASGSFERWNPKV